MDLLKFLSLEETELILEAESGQQYRLEISDELKGALRREAARATGPSHLSPRQIQDEVRSGKTLEQLSATTGESIEFLEKFAAPVLDEIEHIVDVAKATRVNVPSERGSDFVQHLFGDLVEERMLAKGGRDLNWGAYRSETGPWHITCLAAPGDLMARWEFDPKRLVLSPDNPLAVELGAAPRPASGPRALLDDAPKASSQPVQLTTDLEDTQALSQDVIPFPRQPLINAAPETQPILTPVENTESLAETADLLEALRRRKSGRTGKVESAEPGTLGASDREPETAPEAVPTPSEPADSSKDGSKKGRPDIPWDEIVFGNLDEDN